MQVFFIKRLIKNTIDVLLKGKINHQKIKQACNQ